MIMAFIYGLGTGIVLSSMLGTVFFSLIQTSIAYGVRTTLFISAGVIFSDMLLIALTYYNAALLPENSQTEWLVRLAGAAVLLGMGLSNLLRRASLSFPVLAARGKWLMVAKGFTLNFFNPGNFISWLSVSALLAGVLHYSTSQKLAYYAGALTAILLAEVLIAYGARFLKQYISDRFLFYLNRILGLIFCGFAIALLWPLVLRWLGR